MPSRSALFLIGILAVLVNLGCQPAFRLDPSALPAAPNSSLQKAGAPEGEGPSGIPIPTESAPESQESSRPEPQGESPSASEPERPLNAVPATPPPSQAEVGEEKEKPRGPVFSLPGLIPPPDSRDIVETGRLIPSVYYTPLYNEDENACPGAERVPLRDMKGSTFMNVCPKVHFNCGYQGSCVIQKGGKRKSFNIVNRVGGEDRFMEVSNRCKHGYGIYDISRRLSFCLEPYVTIAADMDYYRPGDVIYVPKARNMELPNGKRHDGYFLVSDKGRLIKGKGRFDFFGGHYHWLDSRNPLSKVGLHDKTSDHVYHKVKGPEAEAFRRSLRGLIQGASIELD